jgi:branched-chain amino acid transport system ATP-binding protein
VAEALLTTKDLTKAFGAHRVLAGIRLSVGAGEVVGLLGPNASGKSTLLNVITGFSPPDSGSVAFDGIDITGRPPYRIARHGLVRTFQLPSMPRRMTVREVVAPGGGDLPEQRWLPIHFTPFTKNPKEK